MTPEIDTTSSLPARTTRSARRIVHRTSGHPHGGITRLMSPGDLGELVKPFVFLDHFELDVVDFPELPMHPHSGISTHTTLMQGGLYYEDSTSKSGHLEKGSVEYMQADGGVWLRASVHRGITPDGRAVTIPIHGGREIGPPLFHKILRQLGLSEPGDDPDPSRSFRPLSRSSQGSG